MILGLYILQSVVGARSNHSAMPIKSCAVFFSKSQSVIINGVSKTTRAAFGGFDTLWLFNMTSLHGQL